MNFSSWPLSRGLGFWFCVVKRGEDQRGVQEVHQCGVLFEPEFNGLEPKWLRIFSGFFVLINPELGSKLRIPMHSNSIRSDVKPGKFSKVM